MIQPFRHLTAGLIAGLAAFSFSAPAASQSTEDSYAGVWPDRARIAKLIEGTTVCRVVSTGSVCGVDRWTMTVHENGSRVLRIAADDFTYDDTRYVTLHMDADGLVREAHIMSHVDGDFFGSMNARIEGDEIVLNYLNPDGAGQDRVKMPEGAMSLGTGPAPADGWHYWYYDKATGGSQPLATYWIGSPARGDMHGQMTPASDKSFEGTVELEMNYGTVEADAFKYSRGTTMWTDPTDRYVHRMEMNLGPRGHYMFDTEDLRVIEWSELVN